MTKVKGLNLCNATCGVGRRMAKTVAPEKVSRLDREFLENGSKKLTKLFAAIFFLFLLGVGNAWGAAGDEITSVSNIESGKIYFIKGVNATNTYYLTFPDATGSQSGTGSTTIAGAVPVTFTSTDGGWYLTTPSGKYIAPGTDNSKINVSSSAIVVSASDESSKIRLSITSGVNTWSIQKNTGNNINFGGYKNTQNDVTLIEAGVYSIGWSVNGKACSGSPTTTVVSGRKVAILPTTPTSSDCDNEKVFVGWTATQIVGTTNTKPSDLFAGPSAAPPVIGDVTYYAVFATAVENKNLSATYSISSWSTFGTPTGTIPPGSCASIVETYGTSQQITGSNSQTVTLDGWGTAKIKNISLSMKSNGSAGAGILSYSTNGGSTYSYIIGSAGSGVAFSNAAWNGSWSTSYVDVSKDVTIQGVVGNAIKIKIDATTSSLYCRSYSFTYEGYDYSSYATACCDGLGEVDGDVTLTKTVKTITATWPKTEDERETGYSLQLYDNDGTGVQGDAIGDPIAVNDVRDGYRTYTFTNLTPNHEYFIGVTPTYSGDDDYCPHGTEVTNNATTNAGYTVTYDAGDGGTGTMTDSDSPYDAGATVTVLTNTFTKPGYPFTGWSAVDDSDNEVDVSSDSFTMPSSDVTIIATWGDAFVDTFKDKEHGKDDKTRTGANQTTPTCTNTTPGDYCGGKHYKFIGWVISTSVNEDGTLKNDAVIVPGGQSGWNCTGSTYYAVWAAENE